MKLKHFIALLLIFAGLGCFSCADCFQLKKEPKLTKNEKIAKKYNENRVKIKKQIEITDKLMQEADSSLLVNDAEIQNSQSLINSRNQSLKMLENAVNHLGSKPLGEDEQNLLKEILSMANSPQDAQEYEKYLKNPDNKLSGEDKTIFDEAISLYRLESETEINTLNAYITKLQEQIFAQRQERKKLAIQKDELQGKLFAAEQQCDEIERKISLEKEERAAAAPNNPEIPAEKPQIAISVIVPPNAFKFVKFEPETTMFDIQLRNYSLFIPVQKQISRANDENIEDVALGDDYSFTLLEDKPVVWLEEVVQPLSRPDSKVQEQKNEQPLKNASTAVVYCFEQLCVLNLPLKIHNPAMTEDISELKKYKELNLNTYFTFTTDEIIFPENFINKR